MTTPETSPATKPGLPPLAKKAIGIVVAIVALFLSYLILAAFLPRWWGTRVSNLAGQSFTAGIAWGLLLGLVCTLVPLILFRAIWQVRRFKYARVVQLIALGFGVIVAIPNLLTLTIVLGTSDAAHSGERSLDTGAPGFRGASLTGAVIAVALFLVLVALGIMYNRRGKQLDQMRGDQRVRDADVADHASQPEKPFSES